MAVVFKLIGYPGSLNPKPGDLQSVEMLYTVPRVLMGLLAVLDTFIVYKIGDKLYNRNVAFIASLLFAVMPMTWMLRRIYLDSILLPFLLSSIFFALYFANKPINVTNERGTRSDYSYALIPVVLLSGILLGLAIFTKIPAFTMIPLVAYLIYKNNNSWDKKRRLKILGLWFIPVIMIPAIWPVYNALYDNFDGLWSGIIWQTTGREDKPLISSVDILLQIDPVLLILAIAGIAFSVVTSRDLRLVIWVVPSLIFLTLIGFVSFFYFIPLIPAFCIATAVLIAGLSGRLGVDKDRRDEIQNVMDSYITKQNKQELKGIYQYDGSDNVRIRTKVGAIILSSDYFYYGLILIVAVFGFICTTMLITTNISTAPFQATAFVAGYLSQNDRMVNEAKSSDNTKEIVIFSNPIFSWMFEDVYELDYRYMDTGELKEADNFDRAIIVIDKGLRQDMENHSASGMQLRKTINDMHTIGFFEEGSSAGNYRGYPYSSMRQNFWSDSIEVVSNK